MIIIRGTRAEDKEKADISVKETSAGYKLYVKELDKTFQFNMSEVKAPDICHVTKSVRGDFVLIWATELCHSRDSLSAISIRKVIPLSGIQSFYASIAVAENGETAIIALKNVFIEGKQTPEVIPFKSQESNLSALERLFPAIRPFTKYCIAKAKAMGQINTIDSLAALEFQLDLLSATVRHLVEKLPVSERPAWWDAFEASWSANLSFEPVGMEKALQEIASEKEKTRKTQADYYAELTNGI
jgi:hypothetical protein